ncbi:hypothetical protein MKW94_014567 [Papaver nudicaule]|uniref:GYF domain-containing protein n=1 Tax=Papaver nudicaule TaxID=74823 RepID=A0AA41SE18_PAPNU|nr:hypothetical protein [Papaver nudicaule]
MAERSNVESRDINVESSLNSFQQISKDMQGSDNLIPLSPQWLLSKPGESKSGIDPLLSPYPGYGGRSDISKASGNGDEVLEADKKRDVFRPTVHDQESGRRDRWRDEERDTGSAIRRDRWREGDKELTDPRKTDRWVDNSSNRGAGEARRPPSERWSDSSNRETNYDQHRENKWNTRWGPDEKESDSWREKLDVGRDGEVPRDKGLPYLSPHGKDEREGDHYRPWRSTASQSRGKGESPQPLTQIATKQTPFGYGRSRGDNAPPTFSIGRGRVGSAGNSMQSISSNSYPPGSVLEKGESGYGDASPLKYSRTRLLDLFRTTDLRSHKKPLDGFAEIPSLTQEDPLEPLALSAPTPEELVILKGIDKGDIVSSGLPQASKDGSVGRNTSDGVQSRRNKFDDLPPHSDDYKDESVDNSKGGLFSRSPSKEKYVPPLSHRDSKFVAEALRSDGVLRKKADEAGVIREVGAQGGPSANPVAPWRSQSHGEHTHGQLHDWRGLQNEGRSRTDTDWSRSQKDRDSERENSAAVSSHYRAESNWRSTEGFHSETSRDPIIRRQPSGVLDREQEARKFLPQTSPEDLSLYYKDPQNQIQGPFSGSDLIGWFEAGFFGIDLEVRVAGAPPDTPFSSLGDVMPHLRAKARPPPGFPAPKQSDVSESINVPKFGSMGKHHAAPSEIDILKTDPRSRQGSITETDNRYLESLMSGNTSSSSLEKFSEGLQGYIGNNSGGMHSMGVDSGRDVNYLMAQKMALERQRSIPSPHSYWPGRDAAPMVPNADIVPETPPHAKLLPSVDSSRQIPLPQSMDLMSLLQGVADKSPVVNNGASAWSNFPVQGVMRQEKTDLHQNQQFPPLSPYGLQQQQRLQAQNLPSSTSMIGQNIDPGVATKENMLSSVLSQDPQMLSMLQDQYLISQLQLHSQASVPQQLSVLDKLLLLKQQQQKQEQQQQLLRQQQQQQLLSQVLSERQSHQHFGDPSYAHIQAAMAAGSGPLRPPHEFLMNSQAPIPNLQGGLTSSSSTGPQISNDVGLNVSSGVSPLSNLPHHIFEGQIPRNGWDTVQPEHISHNQNKDVLPVPAMAHGTPLQEPSERSLDDLHVLQKDGLVSSSYDAVVQDHISQDISKGSDTEGVELSQVEPHSAKEEKSVEVREVKKASEKKSRKQKNSKAQQSADQAKGGVSTASLQQQLKLSEGGNLDSYVGDAVEATLNEESQWKAEDVKSGSLGNEVGTIEGWGGSVSLQNAEAHSVQRAWKPAPGFKPKSLLEIQQEEQWKAQAEIATSEPVSSSVNSNFSSPWGVVVPNLEPKPTRDNYQDAANEMFMPGKSSGSLPQQKNRKSQLHDLLAEEVLAKSYERVVEEPPLPVMTNQVDSSVDDSNFIEAKDTKKGRKKSGKGKGTGGKAVAAVVVSSDVHVASSPVEKGKNTRQVQQEKEVLPAPPSGPSLGDFVLWKGEPANPSAAPAWSTEPGKLPKPTSLRDIQKEQEKRGPSVQQQQVQVRTPQKVQSTKNTRGSGASWPIAGTSPSKSTSAINISSVANAQSKSKADADLFWGPLDQSKQEANQSDFPAVNWGSKSSTMKGTQGGVASRQKSTANKPVDYTLSSSSAAQSSLKDRRDAKHSEAMDFRDWCESEAFRLIGSTDTSFLEFCLKQSTSEAETLLIENLGSYDPDHKFIDKFLNYKEMLSADVLEIAFQVRSDRKSTGTFVGEVKTKSNVGRNGDLGHTNTTGVTSDGFTQGGGKKKGKKGKKVSGASLLGFNVKSNRIMMGEIQTIDD